MTAVDGGRAAGPPVDDEAVTAPPGQAGAEQTGPEQTGPEQAGPEQTAPEQPGALVPEARQPQDDTVEAAAGPEPGAPEPADDGPSSADGPEKADDAAGSDPGDPDPADEAVPASAPGGGEPPASPPPPDASPSPRRRPVAAAVLVGLLLTVGGGIVGAWAALALRPAPLPAPIAAPAPAPAPTGLVDAVGAVAPAVLRIEAGSPETGNAGTALVVTPTGDVVTNEHLVHGESTATLIHPDGHTSTARVVKADEEADLAWLQIDGAQGLPVVRMAGPAAVRPGEDVVAIGNALNLDGPPSVTRGVVSAVGRSTAALTDVIQTDAAISSGSSGGALVDRSGTVVGITTEALVGDPSVSVEDIAFAIPADRVVTVLRGMGLVLPPG